MKTPRKLPTQNKHYSLVLLRGTVLPPDILPVKNSVPLSGHKEERLVVTSLPRRVLKGLKGCLKVRAV